MTEARCQSSDYSKSTKYNSDKFWEVQGAMGVYNPAEQVREGFPEEVIFG